MILLMAAAAAVAGPDVAIGRWRTETKNGIVEIAPCGPSICGKLVGSDGLRANPDLRDFKNKDESQRTRRLSGITMLQGFTRGTSDWSGGTVYNPADGGTYKATVTPIDSDHIRMRGCIFWPACKSETWTRIR